MGCFLKYQRNNSLKNPANRNSDDKKFDRLQEELLLTFYETGTIYNNIGLASKI